MYMDNIKIYAKNETELRETIRIYCQDIGIKSGIEKKNAILSRKSWKTKEGIELQKKKRNKKSVRIFQATTAEIANKNCPWLK